MKKEIIIGTFAAVVCLLSAICSGIFVDYFATRGIWTVLNAEPTLVWFAFLTFGAIAFLVWFAMQVADEFYNFRHIK